MMNSVLFAGVGVLGAGYSLIISAVAINRGPKCVVFENTTHTEWSMPFSNGWDTTKEKKNKQTNKKKQVMYIFFCFYM